MDLCFPKALHRIITLSTLYQHFVNTLSTLYQHFINTLSTLYQHFINNLSTPCHQFINTSSTLSAAKRLKLEVLKGRWQLVAQSTLINSSCFVGLTRLLTLATLTLKNRRDVIRRSWRSSTGKSLPNKRGLCRNHLRLLSDAMQGLQVFGHVLHFHDRVILVIRVTFSEANYNLKASFYFGLTPGIKAPTQKSNFGTHRVRQPGYWHKKSRIVLSTFLYQWGNYAALLIDAGAQSLEYHS